MLFDRSSAFWISLLFPEWTSTKTSTTDGDCPDQLTVGGGSSSFLWLTAALTDLQLSISQTLFLQECETRLLLPAPPLSFLSLRFINNRQIFFSLSLYSGSSPSWTLRERSVIMCQVSAHEDYRRKICFYILFHKLIWIQPNRSLWLRCLFLCIRLEAECQGRKRLFIVWWLKWRQSFFFWCLTLFFTFHFVKMTSNSYLKLLSVCFLQVVFNGFIFFPDTVRVSSRLTWWPHDDSSTARRRRLHWRLFFIRYKCRILL